MTKVVLISSGQPSINPRLVKEADCLVKNGFDVTIFYQYWNSWASELDIALFKNKKWKAICVGGTPNSDRIVYWTSRINHKIYYTLSSYFPLKYNLAEKAICRSNALFLKKAIKAKADIYIAHNLGAMPACVLASKKNNAKCGFDAEDFHRNEVSNNRNNQEVKLKSFIEDRYIKELNYFSVASPLIGKAYNALYPTLSPIIINNVFEIKYQPPININFNKGLKLFWFSQTIGKNRGLEDVIEALNIIKNPQIELHLLGNLSIEDSGYFNNLAHFNIQYHNPISGNEIFNLAATFDVGLALEPGFCFNNEIALSNKLFSYLISGLAIIASNTQAQQQFIEKNAGIGKLYQIGNVNELSVTINEFINKKELLNDYKKNAYHLAQSKYNWEMEKEKFLSTIKSII